MNPIILPWSRIWKIVTHVVSNFMVINGTKQFNVLEGSLMRISRSIRA